MPYSKDIRDVPITTHVASPQGDSDNILDVATTSENVSSPLHGATDDKGFFLNRLINILDLKQMLTSKHY